MEGNDVESLSKSFLFLLKLCIGRSGYGTSCKYGLSHNKSGVVYLTTQVVNVIWYSEPFLLNQQHRASFLIDISIVTT